MFTGTTSSCHKRKTKHLLQCRITILGNKNSILRNCKYISQKCAGFFKAWGKHPKLALNLSTLIEKFLKVEAYLDASIATSHHEFLQLEYILYLANWCQLCLLLHWNSYTSKGPTSSVLESKIMAFTDAFVIKFFKKQTVKKFSDNKSSLVC